MNYIKNSNETSSGKKNYALMTMTTSGRNFSRMSFTVKSSNDKKDQKRMKDIRDKVILNFKLN